MSVAISNFYVTGLENMLNYAVYSKYPVFSYNKVKYHKHTKKSQKLLGTSWDKISHRLET